MTMTDDDLKRAVELAQDATTNPREWDKDGLLLAHAVISLRSDLEAARARAANTSRELDGLEAELDRLRPLLRAAEAEVVKLRAALMGLLPAFDNLGPPREGTMSLAEIQKRIVAAEKALRVDEEKKA